MSPIALCCCKFLLPIDLAIIVFFVMNMLGQKAELLVWDRLAYNSFTRVPKLRPVKSKTALVSVKYWRLWLLSRPLLDANRHCREDDTPFGHHCNHCCLEPLIRSATDILGKQFHEKSSCSSTSDNLPTRTSVVLHAIISKTSISNWVCVDGKRNCWCWWKNDRTGTW